MKQIHLSRAHITDLEEAYVLDALRSGWVAPAGPHVDAFERELADRVGTRGALALSSGTAALHLALLEVGAGPGSLVPVPTLTFAATANAVVYTGAAPVFVDSDADGNVSAALLVDTVDALVSQGHHVPAVVVVDLFGRCADYEMILPAMADRGVAVVEDAAEALGASFAGKAAGSFGRCAALSFNGNKIMTTSSGGALLSDDLDLLEHARHLATQAREPVPWYEHVDIGFNYRLSNILAALGRAQLTRLDEMIERRRAIRGRYAANLCSSGGLRLLGAGGPRNDSDDNCWLTPLWLDETHPPPRLVVAELNRRGVDARMMWKPMHLQPAYADRHSMTNGHAEKLFDRCLVLPTGSELDDEDIDYVVDAVLAAVRAGDSEPVLGSAGSQV